MEVKKNTNNNQKYISLPSDSKLKEGDIVKVIKIKPLTLQELKNYFEENKEQFKTLKEEIIECDCISITPDTQFIEHFKKLTGIEEALRGDYKKYILGDTWVEYDLEFDEINEYRNFAHLCYDFESVLANEIFNGQEGYVFDKEMFTKEQLINTALLNFLIKLKKLQKEVTRSGEMEIFSELGFFIDNDRPANRYEDFWVNYDKGIRIVRDLTQEFDIKLEPIENKDSIKYDVSELI